MRMQVFISSVQKELNEERVAIRTFIENDPLLRRFFDVFLFEQLPASDRRTDEVYLEQVDRCGVYLGIFGGEYGFEDGEGFSPTEREFDRATAKGKTRLIFVKGSDDQGRHPKIQALIRKAGAQLIRRRFNSIAELTAAVYASLVEYLEQTGHLRTKPFDASACPEARISDLSREKLSEFLAVANAERGYAIGPRTSTQKALAHLNLLDGEEPTHAAVLLFGKQPQRFLISSEVKCMHFHGREVRKPIPSYHIYKGTVFELVDQATDFVMSKINRAVVPRDGRVTSDVDYELPFKAVREAIVNAITHRDYTSNASVQVMLFADRLEVWNPGQLPPSLTIADLRKSHASIPHNPLIAEPMFLSTYAEKAGSGILDMFALCRQANLPAPNFRQDGGQFVQTIWRPKTAAKALASEQSTGEVAGQVTGQVAGQVTGQVTGQVAEEVWRIILVLQVEKTRKEIQDALQLRGRANFEERYLKPALGGGFIKMTIPDKPQSRLQKYCLTDKGRKLLKELAP